MILRLLGSLALAGTVISTACGGGGRISNTTKGGTATTVPNSAQTSAPTVKREVPTIVPTIEPVVELSQEQINQLSVQIKDMLINALKTLSIRPSDLSKTGDPNAQNEMLSPEYIAKQFSLCDIGRYGETFGPPDAPRTFSPSEKDYSAIFLGSCAKIASTSKVLYEATGDERFKRANESWEPVHKQIFDELVKKDSRVSKSWWFNYTNLYDLQVR